MLITLRFSGGTHLCSTLGIIWDGVKKNRAVWYQTCCTCICGVLHKITGGYLGWPQKDAPNPSASPASSFFVRNFMSRKVDCPLESSEGALKRPSFVHVATSGWCTSK